MLAPDGLSLPSSLCSGLTDVCFPDDDSIFGVSFFVYNEAKHNVKVTNSSFSPDIIFPLVWHSSLLSSLYTPYGG